MNKSVYIVFLCVVFLGMTGCSKSEYVEESPALMTLKINVGLSDIHPQTRADYSVAEYDEEKMHTLRVIIVRPSGIVEKMEYIDLEQMPATERMCEFEEIVSGEKKRIFLIVNEYSRKTEENGVVKPVVPYDFSGIEAGDLFPVNAVYDIVVTLNGETEQLTGPLPMSDVHQVEVPRYTADGQEHTMSVELTVRRAAVKFSYYVTNLSDKNFNIVGLEMEKMAHKEYFVPREFDDDFFVVPSVNGSNEYYLFKHDFVVPIALGANMTDVNLLEEAGEKPIYLLEGKYEDGEEEEGNRNLNYKLALKLQCDDFGSDWWRTSFEYFPELPEFLRRNTHVVVHATIKHDLDVKWEVHVHPYVSVPLEPDFGL